METLPHEGLWAGTSMNVSNGHVPVVRAVCCDSCNPNNIECILPILQMLIRVVARSMCDHGHQSDVLCAPCALEVLTLAERCRNSTWWNSLSEEEEAEQALDVVSEFGLIGDEGITELNRAFEIDRWFTHGGDSFVASYVEPRMRSVSVELGHRVVDSLQRNTSPPWPRVEARIPGATMPPRAAYNRAEAAIAERLGLSEPARHTVEAMVRSTAVQSVTEADFVRIAGQRGLRLIPFIDPTGEGVLAYSAALTSLPDKAQREYGGKSLARDLTLSRLRESWGQLPDAAADAWATWVQHSGMQAARLVPPRRGDGLWRWVHPEAEPQQRQAPPVPPPSTPHARRTAARVILRAGQAGWCAMRSIRYHHWRTLRTGHSNENAWLIAEGDCLDHDHGTGLIRGLLCKSCNSIREPVGAKVNEAVWRAYVANPPAAELDCAWPYD